MKSYPPRASKNKQEERLEKLIWFLPELGATLLIIFIGILYIFPFTVISLALYKIHGLLALLVLVVAVAVAVAALLIVVARYRSKSHRLIRKVCKERGYSLKVRHNPLTTAVFARKGPDMVIDTGEEVYAVKYMPILVRKLQVTFNRTHATMQSTLRFLTKAMIPIPVKKKLKFDTDCVFVRPDQKLVKVMLFCPTPIRVYGFQEREEKGVGLAPEAYNPDTTGMTMVVQASNFGNKLRMVTLKPLETDYNEFEMDNGMQDIWGTLVYGGFAFARYLDRLEFERKVKQEKAHRQSKNAWEKYRNT